MGDCFQVAYDLVTSGELGENALLVHGLPIGTGLRNLGQRYWHAWVEITERTVIPPGLGVPEQHREITLETVIDRSRDQDWSLPRGLFYNVGRLDEERVWRYTRAEALVLGLETETYGPWVDGWEEMGL